MKKAPTTMRNTNRPTSIVSLRSSLDPFRQVSRPHVPAAQPCSGGVASQELLGLRDRQPIDNESPPLRVVRLALVGLVSGVDVVALGSGRPDRRPESSNAPRVTQVGRRGSGPGAISVTWFQLT
jgi:hypothetical protein